MLRSLWAVCVFMLGCGMLVGLWALLPVVAPSAQTLGATSGLITQITLVGVLVGPPAALFALSKGHSGFLVFVGILPTEGMNMSNFARNHWFAAIWAGELTHKCV